jgi:hypothetical protein
MENNTHDLAAGRQHDYQHCQLKEKRKQAQKPTTASSLQ